MFLVVRVVEVEYAAEHPQVLRTALLSKILSHKMPMMLHVSNHAVVQHGLLQKLEKKARIGV